MANVNVAVGARVKSRGRVGGVVSVDDVRSLVTVKYDDAKVVCRNGVPDETLSEADAVVGEAEVEVLPVPELVAPVAVEAKGKAATPTQAQIAAVRQAAARAGRAEGLNAQELISVQEEAEAELVARMGRGEAA